MVMIDVEPLQRRLCTNLERLNPPLVGGLMNRRAAKVLEAVAKQTVMEAERAGELPPGYFEIRIRSNVEARVMTVGFVRNVRAYPFTAQDFYDAFGDHPTNDDLERVNCLEEHCGPGHMLCGLCDCGLPRWLCEDCLGEIAQPSRGAPGELPN